MRAWPVVILIWAAAAMAGDAPFPSTLVGSTRFACEVSYRVVVVMEKTHQREEIEYKAIARVEYKDKPEWKILLSLHSGPLKHKAALRKRALDDCIEWIDSIHTEAEKQRYGNAKPVEK